MSLIQGILPFVEMPASPVPQGSFVAALKVQRRVSTVLMWRDVLMRCGHENLGFFRLTHEPLLMTMSMMIMWTLGGMEHVHGVGLVPFVLTGYTMITLWRHLVADLVHDMTHNAGLMFRPRIRMIDVLSGHATLENLGGLVAFFIAYIPLYMARAVPEIHDQLLLVGGWTMIAWLGFGFGLTLAGLSEFSKMIGQFVELMMFIGIPATGTFYMLACLLEETQKILFWHFPLHPFEMFRTGLFRPVVEAQFSVSHMVLVCTIMTAIGLVLVRAPQNHVQIS